MTRLYVPKSTEPCSSLDYHGETRRMFVGLDNGTISVSKYKVYYCTGTVLNMVFVEVKIAKTD